MAWKSECYRPPKSVSKFTQLRAACRGSVASQSQKPQQAVNVHIQHSNAPSKSSSQEKSETAAKSQNDSTARQANPITTNPDAWGRLIGPHNIAPSKSSSQEKSETAAKSQNDSTARQANPITTNPDAWGRLIGPHNIAPIRLNSLETTVLLDTGAQISSIGKQWVEDLGLPLYDLENIVDTEQAGGSTLDYEGGFTEVTITSDQISDLELNIPLLVVPYIPYYDQLTITLGTLTLKNIMEVLENTPNLSPSWKYVQQSLELTEKLESNHEEDVGVAQLSKAITIPAFQTKGVCPKLKTMACKSMS